MSTMVPAKKNSEYIFYTSLASQAYPYIFQDNPTLVDGDVKVAVDDAAPANIINLPEVDADFAKRIKITLTASEMNGDNITIIFSDVAGNEWCDHVVNIQTTDTQIDDISDQINDLENLSQDDVITAMWTKTVINKSTGAFTVYKANGVDVLITGTITASVSEVTRSID